MSEEEKKTNDEGKTIPNQEGYTIVKYSEFVSFMFFFFGMMAFFPFAPFLKEFEWLPYIVWLICIGLFWLLGRKITEVKVNLRITEKGLEQTRLSGSKFYPEYRVIEWKEMKRYYLYGRSRGVDFIICIDGAVNFRISMPLIRMFEKQKHNNDNLVDFREEFERIATEHGVKRSFFIR